MEGGVGPSVDIGDDCEFWFLEAMDRGVGK